jgi:hypothetical protein
MAPKLCPTFTFADDCNCEDETTQAGGFIDGAWIGWNEPAEGYRLADAATLIAPDDPRVVYSLYGSETLIDCPTDQDLGSMTQLIWGDTGSEVAIDLEAVPVERGADGRCVGGLMHLDFGQLGISMIPTDGEGTDCGQAGGYRMLVLVAGTTGTEDRPSRVLLVCPFIGLRGTEDGCLLTLNCCAWNQTDASVTPCSDEGGTANIHREYVLSGECDCVPTLSVSVDGTIYEPDGAFLVIDHPVSPCDPGDTISITTTIVYPDTPPICVTDCGAGSTFTEDVLL